MYRLLIVDDDQHIRERLKELLTRHTTELELVGEASQGQEAMDLFEAHRPHIVITDINIPIVDGLELARRIRAMDEDVQIIVITGYGTLDFAREAIKTGTVDFLLKPLKENELAAAVRRCTETLNEKTAALMHLADMETMLRESLPMLRERYLVGLATQPPRESSAEIQAHLERLGVQITGTIFFACVLVPDYVETGSEDWEVFDIALSNITVELASERSLCATVGFDPLMRCIVLVQGKHPRDAGMIEDMLLDMKDKLRFYYPFNFSGAVGRGVPALDQLHESCKSALEALDYRAVYGSNNIVNAENVYLYDKPETPPLGEIHNEILTALRQGERDEYQRVLAGYAGQVLAAAGGTVATVQKECVRLLARLTAVAEEVRLHEREIFAEEDPYARILASVDARRATGALVDACTRVYDHLHARRAKRSHHLIQEAREYIDKNLHDPALSLARVSAHTGLSTVYFCSLFKAETGMNFSEYLNRTRVEKAKQLLRTTHMKAYEVALEVGYANPSYFFEVFKKLTGLRPREYLDNVKSNS